MKLKKIKLIIFTLVIITFMTVFSSLLGHSQTCPYNIENCPGICGRWIDVDGDGICDLSVILEETKTDTVLGVNSDTIFNDTVKNYFVLQNEVKEVKNNSRSKVLNNETGTEFISSSENTTQNIEIDTKNIEMRDDAKIAEEKPKAAPRYNFILYSALCFGFYFLSLLLMRFKVYSLKIHRRIWNLLLLITFLVSGILGLVLVIQINYGVMMKHFLQFLQWHVDFGIGMAWISIFHIIWHFKYFKSIFTSSNAGSSKQ